jgi:mono/diheme cytochrome c family protein
MLKPILQFLAMFVLSVAFVVGIHLLLTVRIQLPSNPGYPTVQGADLTATALCFVPTAQYESYLLSNQIWTPTPNAVQSAMATALFTSGLLQGDPKKGEVVFFGVGECGSCHRVTPGDTLVGTSLQGISNWGAYRKPGMSAKEYLLESILHPDDFIVPGMPAGIMPRTYADKLTNLQIGDLVAYMLTL